MFFLPSRRDFIENLERGIRCAVSLELPFMPPQQAFESVRGPESFLLESIKGPEKIARYSFAGAGPFLVYRVKNGVTELRLSGKRLLSRRPPLKILRELLARHGMQRQENLPPFTGGAVGLISYDFVHYFERLPRTVTDDLQIPDAHFLLVDTVIAIDHIREKSFIISSPACTEKGSASSPAGGKNGPDVFNDCLATLSPGEIYDLACERITGLYKQVYSTSGIAPAGINRRGEPIDIRHEMSRDEYADIVKKTKAYIKAGDIFQANLSMRVSAAVGATEPWEIYKILSRINPSPFAAYLDMGDYQIVSSSPERLLKFNGNTVETRPIAGTRPRGADALDDIRMRAELLINEKERAEHLMLIDLERNDLGKLSDYGSVVVDEFMITEDYSHVIHIVSNIKGTAAKGKDCLDAIRAAFPGGTITGVPKVRCMEIIDELERVARGPYTGSLGYISFTGAMDLNIIIRTFVLKNGVAYVQAGAGIVADSDPGKEYFETLKKAEALIKTLEISGGVQGY